MKLTLSCVKAALIGATLVFSFLIHTWVAAVPPETVHHEIKIILQPEEHQLEVEDTITLPEALRVSAGGEIRFLLHGDLHPVSPTPGAALTREEARLDPSHLGIDAGAFGQLWDIPVETYRVTLPEKTRVLSVKYAGQIHHPPQQDGEEYARSGSDTPGIISEEGIFLAASSFWYPIFEGHLVSFTLDVRLPAGWDLISQGERTRHLQSPEGASVRWESPEPQDEIYLAGNRFTEYSRPAGSVTAMAFLRTPDKDLADKYLEATEQYLEMYQKLIGPYPYKKFVLVENFWESGYGMPSFTLLGPTIIRFPFILHSSYPHEILHNWWGNGVFVDYQGGNWSEGLTAYLADHLLSEQRGSGAEARRAVLQKYADYVGEGKDFPLTEFRSRYSPVTEAVGYGKTMMFFHMLRRQLTDEVFIEGLRTFYRENKFRRSGFSDLERAFSKVSGKDLQAEFRQWITRAGAPLLRLSTPTVEEEQEGYLLTVELRQKQAGPAYSLHVPVAITLEGQDTAYRTTAVMNGKQMEIAVRLSARPVRVDVDPEFDIFRRLDRSETPPALSQAFGAPEALIVLPSAAPEELREGYRRLAESWKESRTGRIDINVDSEMEDLPTDRSVWIFGWDNRFRDHITAALAQYELSVGETTIRIGQTELTRRRHSVILSARRPENPDLALTWLATDNVAALPGLGRKLPHYGRYSYLGFDGDEPENVVKGEWPVIDSPMTVWIPKSDGSVVRAARAKGDTRQALASLPPVFSEERMLKDIHFLASPELQGRGFGTSGLEEAAEFIAREFREAGLRPGGEEEGSFFQTFKERGGDPEREVSLNNVIGFIPGKKSEWAGQSVVVAAHYDHLGLGWPDVHKGDEGKIHYGADDNASGVSVLLELARLLGKGWEPDRSIVFIAFSGEEAGLRGSRYYVLHERRFPVEKVIGMLNLDTVGRLGKNRLAIIGTGSAREWVHIFNGAGFVTGVSIEPIATDFGSSDQKSFLDLGVPAVQLFSGVTPDFHRPTDTVDKIDPAGLVKVASVVKEAIEYLSSRPEPLTSLLVPRGGDVSESPAPPASRRRVSLGSVPDFAYEGRGVRLSGVSPGSPVEKAGMKEGDVIIRVGTTPVDDLRGFTEVLRRLQPGDQVSITFVRGGEEQTVQVEAALR